MNSIEAAITKFVRDLDLVLDLEEHRRERSELVFKIAEVVSRCEAQLRATKILNRERNKSWR